MTAKDGSPGSMFSFLQFSGFKKNTLIRKSLFLICGMAKLISL